MEARFRVAIYLEMRLYQGVLDLASECAGNSNLLAYKAVAQSRLGQAGLARRCAADSVRLKLPDFEFCSGEVYAAEKDFERAIWWFDRAAQPPWDRLKALRRLGGCLVEAGDDREARWAYMKAVSADGYQRVGLLKKLAACMRRLNDPRALEVEAVAASAG